jgi:hypothetical protein
MDQFDFHHSDWLLVKTEHADLNPRIAIPESQQAVQ